MYLREGILRGVVGVLYALRRRKWWTISLSIVAGLHRFGIYLFPQWTLDAPLFNQRSGGGLEKKNGE